MLTKTYFKVYRTLPDPDYFFIKNEYNGNNTITFNFTSSVFTSANTEYRIGEDGEWTAFVFGSSRQVTIPANIKLYLRGTDWVRKSSSTRTISPTQNVSLGGCIMSLIDYQNIDSLTTIPNYAFSYFISNKVLRADFNFGNVTSIGTYGCANMFYGCSSLTTAPDMSNVTSIGSYGCSNMFNKCTSLTTAPDMSNVTSIGTQGCEYMFNECSALTTAPDMSNVTSIGDSGCRTMFYNCTALTTAPDMSNVTSIGTQGCEEMFQYCSSLTTAPDMSNVTSIGYNGCKSMFSICRKLNYVYAPSVSTWTTSSFEIWLSGVASYGIVRKKSSLTIPSGTSGVPTGWDVENY